MTDPISATGAVAAVSAVNPAGDARTPLLQPVGQTAEPTAATSVPTEPTEHELQAAADSLNHQAQQLQTSLHFQVDHITGQMVISVVDSQDGKVLMQVPSAEALSIAQSLQKTLLLDRKA